MVGEEGEGKLGDVEEEGLLRGLGGKVRSGLGSRRRRGEGSGRIHNEGRVGRPFRAGEEDVQGRRVKRDSLREEVIPSCTIIKQ